MFIYIVSKKKNNIQYSYIFNSTPQFIPNTKQHYTHSGFWPLHLLEITKKTVKLKVFFCSVSKFRQRNQKHLFLGLSNESLFSLYIVSQQKVNTKCQCYQHFGITLFLLLIFCSFSFILSIQ
jgi:hypothetical protein